jgi:transmembrane sensor
MSEQSASITDIAAAQAARWHVRLQAEDAGEEDWLAFERWLAAPANKAAYDAIEASLADVEDHRDALAAALGAGGGLEPSAGDPLRLRTRRWIAVAGALAAAGFAAAVFIGVGLNGPARRTVQYAADATSDRVVTLPDSSTAHLNRGAAIAVSWGRRERRIALERGEAAFRVIHDPAHPFVVAAGPDEIRDVGTEFNVLKTDDRLVVTVREGEVEVSTPLGESMRVGRNFEARLDHQTNEAVRSPVDAEAAFAWREGRLVYHDAALANVVEDLNRYSDRPITIADPDAAALRFTGVLVIDDPAAMTETLSTFLPVRVENADGGIGLRSAS